MSHNRACTCRLWGHRPEHYRVNTVHLKKFCPGLRWFVIFQVVGACPPGRPTPCCTASTDDIRVHLLLDHPHLPDREQCRFARAVGEFALRPRHERHLRHVRISMPNSALTTCHSSSFVCGGLERTTLGRATGSSSSVVMLPGRTKSGNRATSLKAHPTSQSADQRVALGGRPPTCFANGG